MQRTEVTLVRHLHVHLVGRHVVRPDMLTVEVLVEELQVDRSGVGVQLRLAAKASDRHGAGLNRRARSHLLEAQGTGSVEGTRRVQVAGHVVRRAGQHGDGDVDQGGVDPARAHELPDLDLHQGQSAALQHPGLFARRCLGHATKHALSTQEQDTRERSEPGSREGVRTRISVCVCVCVCADRHALESTLLRCRVGGGRCGALGRAGGRGGRGSRGCWARCGGRPRSSGRRGEASSCCSCGAGEVDLDAILDLLLNLSLSAWQTRTKRGNSNSAER